MFYSAPPWQLTPWATWPVPAAKKGSKCMKKLSIRMANCGILSALCKFSIIRTLNNLRKIWILFQLFIFISFIYRSICCRCAQCFRPFQDGIFYEFEGRKYCERDFHVLFAPCCNKCGEFVIGRVIKAMAASWHPNCFCCESCNKELADCGFIRNQVRNWI